MKGKRGPKVIDFCTINESGLLMLAIAAYNEHLKAINETIGEHAG